MTEVNHGSNGEAGFTLVEVLISLFIFSLISVGALIALQSTLDAREAAEAKMEELEQLAAMRRLLADDVATMTLRRNRDGLGGFEDDQVNAPQPDRIELTRRARLNPDGAFPRGDLLRVSWRVENGRLIRAFLPHENPAYVEPPIDRIILENVQSMTVQYGGLPGSISELVQAVRDGSPGSPTSLATVVSITLTHADGDTTEHVFALPDA